MYSYRDHILNKEFTDSRFGNQDKGILSSHSKRR